jgi:hypothetical protein
MDPMQLAQRYGYPSEYAKYDTQYQGAKEAIGWTWWDVNPYATGATNALAFFAGLKATLNLSNMQAAGQLASPQAFFLRAIRVKFYAQPFAIGAAIAPLIQPSLLNDLQQLTETGVLQFTVGQKIYGQWPLWMLPAGGGVVEMGVTISVAALAADTLIDYANNGIADPRAVYSLTKPLFIAPQINFRADLLWPAGAVALATTSPLNIWVGLDGDLIRPVQ